MNLQWTLAYLISTRMDLHWFLHHLINDVHIFIWMCKVLFIWCAERKSCVAMTNSACLWQTRRPEDNCNQSFCCIQWRVSGEGRKPWKTGPDERWVKQLRPLHQTSEQSRLTGGDGCHGLAERRVESSWSGLAVWQHWCSVLLSPSTSSVFRSPCVLIERPDGKMLDVCAVLDLNYGESSGWRSCQLNSLRAFVVTTVCASTAVWGAVVQRERSRNLSD